ncbi:hypothetical protein [Salimicrobium album]|uniref:Uncharacterized protein n=1 Tax=Salimicrobium album TaxID=50717 RepID=A0A1H3DBC6_9BACI|nr:hypothetical protein [Salimicrobium album]SDX63024.1 hypothetical protein SAMN04488081_0879 [Salimicrobium album]
MYTFIMYDGDKVLDTQELNERPVVSKNHVASGDFKANVNKSFIIIEGVFDGVFDISKDISDECKSENERLREQVEFTGDTLEALMMEVAVMKGGM